MLIYIRECEINLNKAVMHQGEGKHYLGMIVNYEEEQNRIRDEFEKEHPEYAKYREDGFLAPIYSPKPSLAEKAKGSSNTYGLWGMDPKKIEVGNYTSTTYKGSKVYIFIGRPGQIANLSLGNSYGFETVPEMIKGKNYTVAINAGFFADKSRTDDKADHIVYGAYYNTDKTSFGSIIDANKLYYGIGVKAENGQVKITEPNKDEYNANSPKYYPMFSYYKDGSSKVIFQGNSERLDVVEANNKDVKWIIGAGQALVVNGVDVIKNKNWNSGIGSSHNDANTMRSMIGTTPDGSFIIVATTGMKTADGAGLFLELGAENAVNLDGGGSTQMYSSSGVVYDSYNRGSGKSRSVGSMIFIP